MWRIPMLLLCALALALAGCGGDDDSDPAAKPTDGGGSTAAAEQPAQPSCKDVPQPQAKPDGGAKRPTAALDPKGTYDVVLKTSCGDITIRLDQKTSPKTAASFAGLAKAGFFDDTVFHRSSPAS